MVGLVNGGFGTPRPPRPPIYVGGSGGGAGAPPSTKPTIHQTHHFRIPEDRDAPPLGQQNVRNKQTKCVAKVKPLVCLLEPPNGRPPV